LTGFYENSEKLFLHAGARGAAAPCSRLGGDYIAGAGWLLFQMSRAIRHVPVGCRS
jgi:hypothetical protein